MRKEHDIFRKPHDVNLTIEERPTPDAYKRFALGETMPMWRVQTEGYTDGTDQLVGIVSRDAGFLDSPDTEWISGGVNTKTPQGVALGRHGNFFHWGFAASPTYMTEEATLVFVNAVHYIARFEGQTPIARKKPGTATRRYVTDTLARITDVGWAQTVERYEGIRADTKKRKAAVRARIAAGEDVPQRDRRILDRPPLKTPGRFDSIRRFIPDDAWAKVDGDVDAITEYLHGRLPYMRSEGWYEIVVDEDLERFGIGNDDIRLLERAIAALGSENDQLARTLLKRYTDESFTAATEWSDWLKTNRDLLFFTESGGFKWLVNSRATTGKPRPAPDLEPTAGAPVAAAMAIERVGDGEFAVTVDVEILRGWHAYDLLPEGSPYTAMTLELQLPDGLKQVGDWVRPKAHPYANDPSLMVYEGRVQFRCRLAGKVTAAVGEVPCQLSYQVCDVQMCLPPTTEKLSASIRAVSGN